MYNKSAEEERLIIQLIEADLSPSDILSALTAKGRTSEQSNKTMVTLLKNLLSANKKLQSKTEKLIKVLETKRLMRSFAYRNGYLCEREQLPFEEFREDFLCSNQPVLLKTMLTDWPALYKWSPDFFKINYGSVEVEVMSNRSSNPHYESEKNKHRAHIRLSEFLNLVINEQTGNNLYLTASNNLLNLDSFSSLLTDIKAIPGYFHDVRKEDFKLWMGGAGTVTPLHTDSINILFIQLYGEKRIKLVPADQLHLVYEFGKYYSEIDMQNLDLDKYPLFKKADVYDIILKPGDILFIPILWWHFVQSLSFSISLSCFSLKPNVLISDKGYTIIE